MNGGFYSRNGCQSPIRHHYLNSPPLPDHRAVLETRLYLEIGSFEVRWYNKYVVPRYRQHSLKTSMFHFHGTGNK